MECMRDETVMVDDDEDDEDTPAVGFWLPLLRRCSVPFPLPCGKNKLVFSVYYKELYNNHASSTN